MRLLIGCLLCCCSSSAQVISPFKDSSIVKTVDLPATEPFDTSRAWHRVTQPFVYIISDKDIHDLFGYETDMKFRDFNFADYHILGEQKCRQCILFCHHDEGRKECHRNRCHEAWIWEMRENSRAFTEIPVSALPWHASSASPRERNSFLMDTFVKSVAGTEKAAWYTTGHGDCMASFKYKLYMDKYHRVLLLKEWNYWGGCRAGGSKTYTLSFSMPAGILYTTKNTVLVEKVNYDQ
ncbi:MAG TPA: hypothetical protein VI461_16815 [Chitinophagaceae bacterium]|nr:hypothetical protein [Chitinophagaceae bacterium]